jgi:hypothetical protein
VPERHPEGDPGGRQQPGEGLPQAIAKRLERGGLLEAASRLVVAGEDETAAEHHNGRQSRH